MSGVIDKHGQWEHCNQCNRWVLLQELRYERPSTANPHGRDLCIECAIGATPIKYSQSIYEQILSDLGEGIIVMVQPTRTTQRRKCQDVGRVDRELHEDEGGISILPLPRYRRRTSSGRHVNG